MFKEIIESVESAFSIGYHKEKDKEIVSSCLNLLEEIIDLTNKQINSCPFCDGTGLNYDAKQESDIPESPTPICKFCEPFREILDKHQTILDIYNSKRKFETEY